MNKLPYIKQEDLKNIMILAHEIKEREGWQNFMFFRKMILCAMYGEMMCGKIAFHTFVQSAQKEYTKIKLNDRTIFSFWDFKTSHTPSGGKDKLYNLNVRDIEKLPIRRIEKMLIFMLQNHYVDKRHEYNYVKLP
jgi:hypothetical protein